MSRRRKETKSEEPVTLYRVMQATIGQELRARYEAPREMSHELLVLLMQMNEQRKQKQ